MSCNVETLASAPDCVLFLNSPTLQQRYRLFALASAVGAIDAGFDPSDWDAIQTAANDALPCLINPAQARVRQANITHIGLSGEEVLQTAVFNCSSPIELARMELYLTCLLMEAVNP